MMAVARRGPSVAVVVTAALLARTLPAAPSEQDQAIAKDLFDKGVRAMEAGRCEDKPTDLAKCKEAREAFKRAYEITGALGALRNLAYTEKGLGMTASAARNFRELARRAPLDPKPERHAWADYARAEASALEPRVPHLVVRILEHPAGTTLTLDGAALPEAAWNTVIDVDPGQHVIRAEAPGRLAFEGTVTLEERQAKTVEVTLEVDPTFVANDAPRPSRLPPLLLAGGGVVVVSVGLGIGYASLQKRNDSCDDAKLCDPSGLDQGRTLADVSTVVTAIGAAALVSGIVWYALTPASKPEATAKGATKPTTSAAVAPWASPNGAGIVAAMRF
jgi:hypothetical protein